MKRLFVLLFTLFPAVLFAQTVTIAGPSTVASSVESQTYQPCCIVNGTYVPSGPFITAPMTVWKATFNIAVSGAPAKFCMLKVLSLKTGGDYLVLGYRMSFSGFANGTYPVKASFGFYGGGAPASPQNVAAQLLCNGGPTVQSQPMQVTVNP